MNRCAKLNEITDVQMSLKLFPYAQPQKDLQKTIQKTYA